MYDDAIELMFGFIEEKENEMKKIKFDFEDYKDEKVAVHCKTLQEAELWCRFMHEHGLTWSDGDSYLDNYWDFFKEDACYCFNKGKYCELERYKKYGYEIIEFEDIYICEQNDLNPTTELLGSNNVEKLKNNIMDELPDFIDSCKMEINVRVEYGVPIIPIENISIQCPNCRKWFKGKDITCDSLYEKNDIYYADFECPSCKEKFKNFDNKDNIIKIQETKYPDVYKDCVKEYIDWR